MRILIGILPDFPPNVVHTRADETAGQISGQLCLGYFKFFLAVRQLTTELMRQVTVPAWATFKFFFLAVRQLTTELMTVMRQVTVPIIGATPMHWLTVP